MKILNKNIKLNSFTHYNVIGLLFCIKNPEYINFYSIVNSWSWSILIIFHSAHFYDNTTFIRMRKKINCGFTLFHVANFILHIVPCIYIYYYPAKNVNFSNTIFAITSQNIWVYFSSNNTMDLSKIYIKFNKTTLFKLHLTSNMSYFIILLCYNYYYLQNKL